MKILCINVSLRPGSKTIHFPLGLAYIATAIKKHGYDMKVLDINAYQYSEDDLAKYFKENKFEVVCMGCIVTGYKYIKQLAHLIKQINHETKIIVGNSVASSIPDILLSRTETDIAIMGEGDVTIVEVLDALKDSRSLSNIAGICYKDNGKIVKNTTRKPIEDINQIPFPEWDLFDMDRYIESCSKYGTSDPLPIPREKLRAFTISTARGCPFRCTFCYNVFKDSKYRYISPPVLVKEMKKIKERYKINYFLYHDDLSLVSKNHAQEMAECFLQEKVNVFWVASCRSDTFRSESDLRLATLLKDSGCVGLSYSLESASPDILKMMNKKINPDDFSIQSRILEKAGLCKWTSLVFGYPQETPETIRRTFDCCIESNIYPSAGYLLPQPGSVMYNYALEHGFIDDEEEYLLKLGDRQDLRINMTKMSNDEFVSNVLGGLERCNKQLKIGLDNSHLIKTQYYRGKRT